MKKGEEGKTTDWRLWSLKSLFVSHRSLFGGTTKRGIREEVDKGLYIFLKNNNNNKKGRKKQVKE